MNYNRTNGNLDLTMAIFTAYLDAVKMPAQKPFLEPQPLELGDIVGAKRLAINLQIQH